MGNYFFHSLPTLLFITLVFLMEPSQASAYVGPGPGLSFITTLIGFLVAILTSIGVIIIYPIRKMLKRRKENKKPQPAVNNQTQNDDTKVNR